jgi:hypothetical protein
MCRRLACRLLRGRHHRQGHSQRPLVRQVFSGIDIVPSEYTLGRIDLRAGNISADPFRLFSPINTPKDDRSHIIGLFADFNGSQREAAFEGLMVR